MEKVVRNVKTNPGEKIFNRTRQCLLRADDAVILGRAVKRIVETLEDMTTVASQMGLITDVSKTKYMINGKKKENEPVEIEINGQ
jgi:hypothetical protein